MISCSFFKEKQELMADITKVKQFSNRYEKLLWKIWLILKEHQQNSDFIYKYSVTWNITF